MVLRAYNLTRTAVISTPTVTTEAAPKEKGKDPHRRTLNSTYKAMATTHHLKEKVAAAKADGSEARRHPKERVAVATSMTQTL